MHFAVCTPFSFNFGLKKKLGGLIIFK